MATPIAPSVPRADLAEAAPPATRPVSPLETSRAKPTAAAEAPPERQPATRLMIEDVGGVFIYTVLDRVSGHVIARIPRDRVEELSETDGYEAGAMINTNA